MGLLVCSVSCDNRSTCVRVEQQWRGMSGSDLEACRRFKRLRGKDRTIEALTVHSILYRSLWDKDIGRLSERQLLTLIGEPDYLFATNTYSYFTDNLQKGEILIMVSNDMVVGIGGSPRERKHSVSPADRGESPGNRR